MEMNNNEYQTISPTTSHNRQWENFFGCLLTKAADSGIRQLPDDATTIAEEASNDDAQCYGSILENVVLRLSNRGYRIC